MPSHSAQKMSNILDTEKKIIEVLKMVYDPEIPVNIYDLGLIYDIEVDEHGKAFITMTLTAPNCPMADQLIEEVHERVAGLSDVSDVAINLTFEPPWDQSKLSEEAKLELGLL